MPVYFSNSGDIPLGAIKTFGVSVKETDTPIGFFGTGLKYAIAVLLRHRCRIAMWSGGSRYEFFTVEQEIRGKRFDLCCMMQSYFNEDKDEWGLDGELQELPFTTELGKTWEPWMAFRELYCNMLDENGTSYHVDHDSWDLPTVVEHGNSVFMVMGNVIEEAWMDRHSTVLQNNPKHSGALADAHIGPGRFLYYRGIRIAEHHGHTEALFDYNLKHSIDLTEDRTLKYQFQARHAILSLVLGSEDEKFIEDVLTAPKGTYEQELEFSHTSMTPSDEFLNVAGRLRSEMKRLNISARLLHHEHCADSGLPDESVPLNTVEQEMLDRAIIACTDLGCDMSRYPIIVAEHLGQGIMGMAEKHAIYIAHTTFDQGTKRLASTILEEYLHLRHEVSDCTREMQNLLMDMIVSQLEQRMGAPL